MQTQCPSCKTVFRVRPSQIEAAGGKVRCGACQDVFDARAALATAAEEPNIEHGPATAVSDDNAAKPIPAETPPEMSLYTTVDEREPAPQDNPPRKKLASDLPSDFLQPMSPAPRHRPMATVAWALANIFLISLLACQYAYLNRATFAAQPALRPWIEHLCALAGCTLDPWRDLAAFALTSRNVQSHPELDKALLVDATFVNRAPKAQPYPELRLMFLDTEERPLASRRFRPAEYLPTNPTTFVAPGAEVHAVLEIIDPGTRAVGYNFEFR